MESPWQPRFVVASEDWKNFADHVSANYPLPSFTHEEKEFTRKALLRGGRCTEDNKLWVNIFADQLMEFVDEGMFEQSQSVTQNLQQLSIASCKAIMELYNVQHALRQQVPKSDRTVDQHRLLEIHPNVMNFPIQLSIDIGRFLKLPGRGITESRQVDSWEEVEDRYLFQKLHNQLEDAARASMPPVTAPVGDLSKGVAKSVSEDQVLASPNMQGAESMEWNPRSTEDNYLRLCTLKVWCEKYEREEPWNSMKMVTDWLQEAIDLYNGVSYHWPTCKIKKILPEFVPQIRHTCIHSWLISIGERAGPQLKGKRPTMNWVLDWCTPPVMDRRVEWENYFCATILRAKHLSRLMGNEDYSIAELERTIEEGIKREPPPGQLPSQPAPSYAMEAGGPPSKKLKMEDGETDHFTMLQNLVQQTIRHELRGIEKRLVAIDQHDLDRHHEMMRELGGHITPLKSLVYHLSNNVTHLHHMVDRVTPSSH